MAAGREDGRLIEQVGEVGSGETRGAAGPGRQRHRRRQRTAAGVDRQDRLAAAAVGQVDGDAAIEAAWAHQGRVEHVGAVGGGQQNHAGVVGEAIHFGEQLVEGLLPFVVAAADASTPLAADRIDLIDKNDAGRLGFGLAEQVPHPTGPHTHEHLDEFGGGHREEGHPRLTGDGSGQQGFAGAGWPHQQHPLGNLGADCGESIGLPQEGDHLLELLFGFGDARHVFKAHRHSTIGLEAWLAAAKSHRPVGHLGRATDQQRQAAEQQQHQQAVGDQSGQGPIGAIVPHRERHLRLLGGAQQQLVVAEHRHGELTAVLKAHARFALAQRQFQVLDLAGPQIVQQLAVGGHRFTGRQGVPAKGLRA